MELERRLSRVMSDFARTVATDFSIQAILDQLVVRIVEVLPITSAGVTLISAHTDPKYIAASDESALRYEQLQSELGEGPCMFAYHSGDVVAVPNLQEDDRFPTFSPRALAEGLAAVFTFPLRDGDYRLGALDLYRTTNGPLDVDATVAAQTLADVAAAYLLNARARDDFNAAAEGARVEQVRQLEAARVEQIRQLEAARVEQVRQVEEAHTDFLSKVSHELRSPLTTVIGYVEMLADGEPNKPTKGQRQMLAIVERSSYRLLGLIEDLLTMSSVEDGSFELDLGPIDLPKIVERAREATAITAAKAGVAMTLDVRSDADLIGDADQLERALLNLVSNAVKFTKPGGLVEIQTLTVGDRVALSVRDSGIGIPDDEQQHLFTRFFRGTRSKDQQIAGTGLGLYIAKQIVVLHGGTITVSSSSEGSTFTMLLPIAAGLTHLSAVAERGRATQPGAQACSA